MTQQKKPDLDAIEDEWCGFSGGVRYTREDALRARDRHWATLKMPSIGEAVEVPWSGGWRTDWLRQARLGDEPYVVIWGETRKRYHKTDVWRPKLLVALPPVVPYTNPQSLWLTKTPWKEPKDVESGRDAEEVAGEGSDSPEP